VTFARASDVQSSRYNPLYIGGDALPRHGADCVTPRLISLGSPAVASWLHGAEVPVAFGVCVGFRSSRGSFSHSDHAVGVFQEEPAAPELLDVIDMAIGMLMLASTKPAANVLAIVTHNRSRITMVSTTALWIGSPAVPRCSSSACRLSPPAVTISSYLRRCRCAQPQVPRPTGAAAHAGGCRRPDASVGRSLAAATGHATSGWNCTWRGPDFGQLLRPRGLDEPIRFASFVISLSPR
jgi:hypothetical protein